MRIKCRLQLSKARPVHTHLRLYVNLSIGCRLLHCAHNCASIRQAVATDTRSTAARGSIGLTAAHLNFCSIENRDRDEEMPVTVGMSEGGTPREYGYCDFLLGVRATAPSCSQVHSGIG
jgi:hypothetical protein